MLLGRLRNVPCLTLLCKCAYVHVFLSPGLKTNDIWGFRWQLKQLKKMAVIIKAVSSVCTCVFMYAHVHTYACSCMCSQVCVHICTRVFMYAHVCVHLYVPMGVHGCVFMCVHVCVCVNMCGTQGTTLAVISRMLHLVC